MISTIRAALAALALLPMAACSTVGGLSLFDNGDTPRQSAAGLAGALEPVLADAADACAVGILPEAASEVLADYGPQIRNAIGAYATAVRPCLVTEGALGSDPETVQACRYSAVETTFDILPQVLTDTGLALGADDDTGKALVVAGILARRVWQPSPGGPVDGWTKMPDLTVEDYDAIWAPVQGHADRLFSCADVSFHGGGSRVVIPPAADAS